jgi:hypothetical protein
MRTLLRGSTLLFSLFGFAWAAGLLLDQRWAKDLWLWPNAPRLNHVFVASVAAAWAAPELWIALTGSLGTMFGGALQLAVLGAASAVTLCVRENPAVDSGVRTYVWVFGAMAIASAAILPYARRFPIGDGRAMPAIVRWSFLVFALVLLGVGLALVLGAPYVFPWPLKPTASSLYGSVFLASFCFYGYGFWKPSWGNAVTQLLAFLAYDAVLVVPFVAHIGKVLPAHRASLTAYLAVIAYSSGLAIYFLFVHRGTRLSLARRR